MLIIYTLTHYSTIGMDGHIVLSYIRIQADRV